MRVDTDDRDVGSVPGSGRLVGGHDGSVVIDAWGPTAVACLTEVLYGLVESFAVLPDAPASTVRRLATPPGSTEDALVALLDEVILGLDVYGEVPLRFHLFPTTDGGVAGDMEVVPAATVQLTAPLPRAESCHAVSVSKETDGWRCRVLVDR